MVIFDILANNNWKRPVYFATSVSEDTYIGLEKYLYLEGYAYRLLPLKAEESTQNNAEQTNTDVMYNNMMDKLDFTAFHTAKYLDLESRRVIHSTWHLSNILADHLLAEGKRENAAQIMKKSMKELPLRNYSVGDTLNRMFTVKNLYALNQVEEANSLAMATSDFLTQELHYLTTLTPTLQKAYMNNIQIGLYVLNGFEKMSSDYRQYELNSKITRSLDELVSAFDIKS